MPDIDIKGTIVGNDDGWIYDYFGIQNVTPAKVKKALEDAKGQDVTIQINSGGGDVFAGNEIYYLIASHSGRKTVDIVGLAASAATIIACAGDTVRAVPGAQYMIHNVSSSQQGDYKAMDHMSEILKNANKTISNVYRLKTGMSEAELLQLMDREKWMDVTKAKECGFIDEIIGDNGTLAEAGTLYNAYAQILSDEVKNKIRNTVKNPDSDADSVFLIEQENLKLLKMRGEFKNVQI